MKRDRKQISAVSRDEILRVLRQETPDLQKRFKVRSMSLFGSFAHGDNKPGSDVDILVDVDPSIGLDFVSLADTLESVLGIPVQLVSRRAISSRNWEAISQSIVPVFSEPN